MKKVITYGTFDLFHEGHRQILLKAKGLGDYLIVGITSDYFDIQRGKMNVKQSLLERIEGVKKCGIADEIIIEEHAGQKVADVQKHCVDIFAIGDDWHGKFDYLNEYCNVVYLNRTPKISSTSLREDQFGIVRLGVVGTGRIATRQAHELKFVSGVCNYAVYNPNKSSADKFASKHGISLVFDNYDEFLEKVDAVYIASPHDTHYDYALRSLNAYKHVLCEKPMTLSGNEAEHLFSVAEQNKLVLMEAIRTAYAPGFINLLAIARDGRIGKIKDIEAAITKLIPQTPHSREYDVNVGGSFTELASGSLLPIIKILGKEHKSLNFDFFTNNENVDLYAKAYLKYDDAIATAKTGIGIKSEGQLLISGTKGYILVNSPWWLTKAFEVCYEDTTENEHFSAPFPGYGMRYELADFIRNIREPELVNFKLTRTDSIALAYMMENFIQIRKERLGALAC
ncbi:MAG: Gfo/Idh/MocA family oxidoreductase [Defluviitaleaceae bacterium]|nr:Gfo/Idh/MocA family oxidoreductase [Defluviitaleaceae bacterium]